MTTESVKFLISAEDRATAKIRKVTEDVERQAKQVKEVGGSAKASTELVGTLANAMGGSGVGQYAGEIAQITERISAFTEVAKGGGKAALAFKVGMAGVAGVLAFKVGKAIGDVIFDTKRWRREMTEATERFRELSAERLALDAKRFERARQLAELELTAGQRDSAFAGLASKAASQLNIVSDRLKAARDQLVEMQGMFQNDEAVAQKQAEIEVLKQEASQLKQQATAARDATSAFRDELALATERKQRLDSSKAYVEQLRKQAEQLEAIALLDKEGLRRRQAVLNTAGRSDANEAIKQLEKIDRLKTQAAEKAKQEREAEQQKLNFAREQQRIEAQRAADLKRRADLQSSIIERLKLQAISIRDGKEAAEALKLQIQGIDAVTARQLVALDKQLNEFGKPQSGPAAALTTQNRRLNSGRQDSGQTKIVANTKTTANNSTAQKQLLGQILTQLELLNDKEAPETKTVGD